MLEQQMASGQMPAGEKVQRTKTLAQLYFRAGSYGKGIQYANQYLKSVPGDQEMQLMVAQGYYQQKDYKGAIAAAERIVKSGQRPSEDALQLLLRSSYEINDKEGTAQALEALLKFYPSPDTWQRVLDGYIAQTKHDDELLSLYRLAEDVGALTKPRQYTDMAQALVVAGFAMEGQRVIEKGIAAGVFQGEEAARAQRTLDSAKRRADIERQELPKAAAKLAAAKTGDEMHAVGKLYFSAGEYAKAADALRKALAKGGLSDVDAADMLFGIALSRDGKTADANKAFAAIKDPKFAEVAKLWILKGR
jgi:tetratricopeptide (TPR) repeat protein